MRHARDIENDNTLTSGAGRDDRLTRRLTLGRRALAYTLLIAVMLAVAAVSWSGLYGFAHTTMRWTPVHAALVPVALDIAAMSCALLALDSIDKGETGVTLRVLTACFVGLSALVNWRHALATGNFAEQIFFPACSILAYALVHAVMGKARREVRREQHGQPQRPPLPRFPERAYSHGCRSSARRAAPSPPCGPASPHGCPPSQSCTATYPPPSCSRASLRPTQSAGQSTQSASSRER